MKRWHKHQRRGLPHQGVITVLFIDAPELSLRALALINTSEGRAPARMRTLTLVLTLSVVLETAQT